MDDRRFDSLTRALASGTSRRSILKGLLGLGGAAATSGVLLEQGAEAARRPTPTPTPPKCPGNQTWNSATGKCDCPPGLSQCNPNGGPACCKSAIAPGSPGYSECCDNACCQGTCYGEELCCPTNRRAGGLPPTHEFCDGTCVDLTVAGNCCDDGDCGDPCQVCNHDRHICVDRCDARTQVCCTEQAGPGICVTGDCCDDGDCQPVDACATTTCRDHQCVATPIVCNDDNACTVDSCDPILGCIHTPVSCNDNNLCTIDSCDPNVGCIFTQIDCDDGNPCTVDTCDPALGCIHTPVSCDDNNLCTSSTCDPERGCVYTTIDCDDGDPCTIDTCNAQTGCVHTPVDCSGLTNPALCQVGTCANGTCVAVSTCPAGTTCCGDSTCSANCECSDDGAFCEASDECCGGCCIANLPSQDDWIKVCTDSGFFGTAAVLCAQAIQEQGYPATCITDNEIVLGNDFPPVTLPCVV